jgi:serine/threonine protein kinase
LGLRTSVPEADPLERLWREQGAAAAVQEIERSLPDASEEDLRRSLCFLGRVKEPSGIPVICRCLGHASEAVRKEARSALHAFGWETVVDAVEGLAHRGAAAEIASVLDGLNAFEAHPQVVGLLDRLVVVLKGELRNRTIVLLERKRLGLGLEKVTALFREIQSPYRPRKALGQGPYTASYLARAEGTELDVVVRVLRPEFVQQPHVRAGFFDLCLQSLHFVHESLVLTREARAFPDRGVYYAVRDYINGVTLQTVLESGKRFQPAQAVQILRQTAAALTPLHRKGIYHGGIKPSNIFLCEDDRVVLGDPSLTMQGVGVALDRLSYDYRYAPPELFRSGEAPGPAADFYALGCVAYELFCGAPPFVEDSCHELANRHVHEPIRFPDPLPLVCRLGVGQDFLLPLLAKSASDRFQSLKDLLAALDLLPGYFQACGTAGPPSPLLRAASLDNYRAGQSLVAFDQSAASPEATADGETAPVPTGPEPQPEIPGYEILGRLGQGGMGTVYKARDVQLNRLLALKVLPAGAHAGDAERARFRTEAEAVARLQHPNIVQIYGLFEHQGFMCLALEFVGGGDLAQKMREGPMHGQPLSIRQAVEMMVTMARAVESAHQHHILHRDLKPSNILLTPDGQPKIGDFGLAKILGDSPDAAALTLVGAIVGTPAYMAPEQADSSHGQVSPATDVYALGNIFYEMLTSQRPFTGGHSMELLRRVTSEKPTPPTRLRPEIPPALESVCLKCLEKDPARRYPTAAALADDLDRWLKGKVVTARPPSIWQRLVRFFSFRKPSAPPKGREPDG